MDARYKAIRALLSSMAPRRAVKMVQAVNLPPDEERAVIAVDVRRESCVQVAREMNISVDGLAKLRRRAYAKMLDDNIYCM